MTTAFGWAKHKNLCTEAGYPYKASKGTCHESICTVGISGSSTVGTGVTGYTEVGASESDLKTAVQYGPVSVAIEADQVSFQTYSSGIYQGSCGSQVDHGVLLVGYGTDTITQLNFYKLKNSWGSSWGDSGYIRIVRDPSANGGDGNCGILTYPAYPLVSTTGPTPVPIPDPTPMPTSSTSPAPECVDKLDLCHLLGDVFACDLLISKCDHFCCCGRTPPHANCAHIGVVNNRTTVV